MQFHGLASTSIVVSVLLASVALGQSNNHPLRSLLVGETSSERQPIIEFLDELEKEILQWRREIHFVGNFVQRESGFGLTPEEAQAQVDISTEAARRDESKVTTIGKFAKLKMALRYQQLPNSTLRYEHDAAGGGTVSGQFTEDLSAANGLEFKYQPKQTANDGVDDIHLGGTVYFGSFDFLPEDQLTTSTLHRFPFEIMGGNFGYPFLAITDATHLKFENTEDGFLISFTIAQPQETQTADPWTVTYEFKESDRGPYLCRRTFKTGESQNEIRLFDFVDCGDGVLFPKGMMLLETSPRLKSRAISWYSKNVGQRQPQEDDFDVKVAPGSKWHGFDPNGTENRWKSVNEEEYTLNVLKLDPKEVESNYSTGRRDPRRR
jgi:hypothetical protein